MKVILKIIDNFQYVDWTGVESKLSSEYFDVGFRDYTDIVMGIWKIYFISLFPIRYILVSEFDIECKPIYFLFRALYLISNVIWFVVNRVFDDIGSLTQLKAEYWFLRRLKLSGVLMNL